MKNKTQLKRKFKIGILPIDENGTKLYEKFGWYSSDTKSHIVTEFTKGQVFEDSGIDGTGSVQDWLNLIVFEHEYEWIVKATYTDNEEPHIVERINNNYQ